MAIAEELAKGLRKISVAEFFEKNKQILGFDTLNRAMLTSVKEGVDNALDSCEDANILPDIKVEIKEVKEGRNEYIITIADNGPGIVKEQIPPIFGKLLYGSRFHSIKQARGQQGIGISAVVLYSQLTTGRNTQVTSKIGEGKPAYQVDLHTDTKKNQPKVVREGLVHWEKPSGTKLKYRIKGRYVRAKKQSVLEYLRSTAIVNPHAKITFKEPNGTEIVFDRGTEKLPEPTKEIKPHPEGTELGILLKMAATTDKYKLSSFLAHEFSRVTYDKARGICRKAVVDEDLRPLDMNREQAQRLLEAFQLVKIMAPPTECLSPIHETLVRKGLCKEREAEYTITTTRPPAVYSGNPFQVEIGLMYGGELPKEEPVEILRYANRVPLLYQQGDCAITKAVESIDWRRYGLEQRGGKGIPLGPAIILAHVASTKIPFTSESKEAIAKIPEIVEEIQLGLRECGRRVFSHIRKKQKLAKMKQKEQIIKRILPLIARKSSAILGKEEPPIDRVIAKIMNTLLIKDEIEWYEREKIYSVGIKLTNYTPTRKSFILRAVVPHEAVVKNAKPKAELLNHIVSWDLKNLSSGKEIDLGFELAELEQGDYEENELYVKDIDAELVTGADEWSDELLDRRREEK